MKSLKSLLFLFVFGMLFAQNNQQYAEPEPVIESVEEYVGDEEYIEDDEYYSEYEDDEESYEEVLPPAYEHRTLDVKFKDKYKGEIYNYDRKIEKKKKKEEKIEERREAPKINTDFISSAAFEIIIYIAVGAIFLLILFLILKNSESNIFGQKKRKIDAVISENEENTENIELNDFEKMILKAKNNGNYRKAIRYYYLWLLQRLSDQKLIKWHKDKTDSEYLYELAEHKINNDFENLLYLYEYVWFGKYKISDSDFEKGEQYFLKSIKEV